MLYNINKGEQSIAFALTFVAVILKTIFLP